MKAREWYNLLSESSCDENYKNMPIKYDNRSWVLRCFPKGDSIAPRYLKTITSPYNKRKKSKAHALFLKRHYDINTDNLKNLDNNTKLMYIKYTTMSYITRDARKVIQK